MIIIPDRGQVSGYYFLSVFFGYFRTMIRFFDNRSGFLGDKNLPASTKTPSILIWVLVLALPNNQISISMVGFLVL